MMDLHSALEIAKRMRSLARRADTFGYDRQALLEAILAIAENYEEVAERIEQEMIDQMQQDWVEAA